MPVVFTPTIVTNASGVQNKYPFTHDVANEGMLCDLANYNSRSYVNQSAVALPIGAMVAQDTTGGYDYNAIRLSTGATLNQGITIDSLTFEGVSQGNTNYVSASGTFPGPSLAADGRPGYQPKHICNVLRQGTIWVYSTEAINIGDPVRFWDVDHSGTVPGAFLGRFCKTLSATRTTLFTNGATWLTKTSGPGLAQLEINMVAATFTSD